MKMQLNFCYLNWRHPANFCSTAANSAPEKIVRKILLPEAECFCKSLLFSGKYEALAMFASYFERLLKSNKHYSWKGSISETYIKKEQDELLWHSIAENFTDWVKSDLLKKNKESLLKEAVARPSLIPGFDHFFIPEFEERYQSEISQIASSK